MDTDVFEVYVREVLAPTLEPGQMVIMDNLSVHKSARISKLIEDKQCEVLFLPAYSPDMSPIEEAFSKLKAYLRKVGARTREDLLKAITEGIQTITQQDARGFFSDCGYQIAAQ